MCQLCRCACVCRQRTRETFCISYGSSRRRSCRRASGLWSRFRWSGQNLTASRSSSTNQSTSTTKCPFTRGDRRPGPTIAPCKRHTSCSLLFVYFASFCLPFQATVSYESDRRFSVSDQSVIGTVFHSPSWMLHPSTCSRTAWIKTGRTREFNPLTPTVANLAYGYSYKASCARPG